MAAGIFETRVRTRGSADARSGHARWYFFTFKKPFLIDLLYTFLQGVRGAVAEEGGHSALTSDGLHIHASATFVPLGIIRQDYVSTQLAVGPLTQCLTSKFPRNNAHGHAHIGRKLR